MEAEGAVAGSMTDMTVAQQTPINEAKPQAVRRNGRWAGYWHLLASRMKELKREPEVVFWVFGFPLLLALGLGIAFRNKPADVSSVAVIGPEAQQVLSLIERSPQKAFIKVEVLTPGQSRSQPRPTTPGKPSAHASAAIPHVSSI